MPNPHHKDDSIRKVKGILVFLGVVERDGGWILSRFLHSFRESFRDGAFLKKMF